MHLLLSHLHLDHVQGLVGFPLLNDASIELPLYGEARDGMSLRARLNRLFGPPYWPVSLDDSRAGITFHEIGPQAQLALAEGLSVRTLRSCHPNRLLRRIDFLEGRIGADELEQARRDTEEAAQRIGEIDRAGFLTDDKLEYLKQLKARTYVDEGRELPWITDAEYNMLCIRKGTLSPAERRIMENHVVVTDKLLSQIRFSKDLSHVREWAAAHHELLNGSGYPGGLAGGQIPYEVRIITILDVFDALVADDRPYKPGMPVARALSILDAMANQEGKLDPELTRLFVESKCWEPSFPER